MKKKTTATTLGNPNKWLAGAIAAITFTFQSVTAAPVKQSGSGICHDRHSSYYERTKNYTGFGTLAACLESGGRLPAGYDGPGIKSGTSAKDAMGQAKTEQRELSRDYDRDDYPHWSYFDGDCQRPETRTADQNVRNTGYFHRPR